MNRIAAASLVVGIALSVACPAPSSGPVDPHWDRDTCAHCRMAIGDRRFAAQVRTGEDAIHHFDDLGCALAWLGTGETPDPEQAALHVRAASGDGWLDARTARYRTGLVTPMGYGFGAVAADDTQAEALLTLEQVRAGIDAREGHGHGAHAAP